jgi:hypothetical protein
MTSRKYRLNSRLVIASSVPLMLDNIYCSNSLLEFISAGIGMADFASQLALMQFSIYGSALPITHVNSAVLLQAIERLHFTN